MLLPPPGLRDGVLREARQLAGAPSPSDVLPLAVDAVGAAQSELWAQARAVRSAALAKDAAEAAEARAAGLRARESGDPKGSLPHFTRALRKSPSDDPSALAVLYTTRSEALLAVGESRAALADATEALLLAPLYPKAWRRYAAALEQPPDTVQSMARRLFGDDNAAAHLSLAAEDEALRVVAELRAAAASEVDSASAADPMESLGLAQEGRPGVDGPGRCLVTSCAVPSSGKVLLADNPVALAVRRAGAWQQRCHWCTAVAVSPIPCPGCADATYCNRACRAAAWAAEHRAECGCVVPLLLPAETTLACRLQRLCSRDGDVAAIVHALQGHEAALDVERCVDRCIQAAMAAWLLQDMLADEQSEMQTGVDGRLDRAKELFEYLSRIDTNSHAITAVVPVQSGATNVIAEDSQGSSSTSSSTSRGVAASIEEVTQERIAVALYPHASLVNHACAPTARVQFSGRQLHLLSATAMRNAAEITISYGPTAGRTGVAKRREQLQEQYHFLCRCSACEDEIPFDADDNSIPDAALDAALGLLDEGRAKEAIATLRQCCAHQMSLFEEHDKAGDTRRAAIVAQRAAEAFDALGRAYCQTTPEPDYSAAADAIEQALSLLRRSTTVTAPGAEPSLAREEHKLATLRFHAAVQAGPGSRGEAAVAGAAKAARRALLCVREALGDDDPAVGELAQMVAALGGAEKHRQAEQRQQPRGDSSGHKQTTVKKKRNGTSKAKANHAASTAGAPAPSPYDELAMEEAKKSVHSRQATDKNDKNDEQAMEDMAKQDTTADSDDGTSSAVSNDRLVLVVARCVEVLRDSSAVDERLAMATQLYSLLGQADTTADISSASPQLERLQTTFLKAGGPEVLYARLASMDDGWLAEAKNGAMDLYDKLARLDFVRDRFVKIAAEDEPKVQEAIHENKCACLECKMPPGAEEMPRKPKSKAAKNKQQKMKAAASTRRPTAPAKPAGVELTALGGLEEFGGFDGASERDLDDAAILLSKEVARAAKLMQTAQDPST